MQETTFLNNMLAFALKIGADRLCFQLFDLQNLSISRKVSTISQVHLRSVFLFSFCIPPDQGCTTLSMQHHVRHHVCALRTTNGTYETRRCADSSCVPVRFHLLHVVTSKSPNNPSVLSELYHTFRLCRRMSGDDF